MRTYELQSVGLGISFALFTTLIGSLFAVPAILWTLGLMTINDKPRADWGDVLLVASFVGFGLLIIYSGWSGLFRHLREIHVGDGFIELVWALRRRRIEFQEVAQIERAVWRDGEGDTRRELSLVLRSGEWIALGEEAAEFASDLAAAYPRIGIYGSWSEEEA